MSSLRENIWQYASISRAVTATAGELVGVSRMARPHLGNWVRQDVNRLHCLETRHRLFAYDVEICQLFIDKTHYVNSLLTYVGFFHCDGSAASSPAWPDPRRPGSEQ